MVREPMMKPLILGEAPSKTGDSYWQFPLSGEVGRRLHQMAGLPVHTGGSTYGRYYWPLTEEFDLINVIERYPGPGRGSGADFPRRQALAGLNRLISEGQLPPGRVVVCLGRRVLKLLVPGELPFYTWVKLGSGQLIAGIPHPSGLTRNYNDKMEWERAGRTLRGAIDRAKKYENELIAGYTTDEGERLPPNTVVLGGPEGIRRLMNRLGYGDD
jgi:uracil-DNA glycosylase